MSEDLVIGLELGLEWIVEFASDTVVDSGVQAFSRTPKDVLIVAFLDLIGDEVEARAMSLIDVGNEDGVRFWTDDVAVLALLTVVVFLPASESSWDWTSSFKFLCLQNQMTLGTVWSSTD